MAYLLDTQVVIWLANEPHKIISTVENILMERLKKSILATPVFGKLL